MRLFKVFVNINDSEYVFDDHVDNGWMIFWHFGTEYALFIPLMYHIQLLLYTSDKIQQHRSSVSMQYHLHSWHLSQRMVQDYDDDEGSAGTTMMIYEIQ